MAKDLDDGYTRIANEVLEDLAKCKFLCVKSRVVLAIIRNTWGWKGHPKERLLSQTYLAQATGASVDRVKSSLRDLSEAGIIFRDGSMTGYNKYWTKNCTPECNPIVPPDTTEGGVDSHQGGGVDLTPSVDSHQGEVTPGGGVDLTQNLVQDHTTKKEKKENRKKSNRRATSLPIDAKLTGEMMAHAERHGMTNPVELNFQWEKFKAHHQAKGDTFKKWDQAWLTWVLNWTKWGKEKKDDGNRDVFEKAAAKFIKSVE